MNAFVLINTCRHPDDVDIFAGGMLERVVPAGTVGATFGCIIGRQFRNSRYGDRFWHERPERFNGFNLGTASNYGKLK